MTSRRESYGNRYSARSVETSLERRRSPEADRGANTRSTRLPAPHRRLYPRRPELTAPNGTLPRQTALPTGPAVVGVPSRRPVALAEPDHQQIDLVSCALQSSSFTLIIRAI